MKKNPILVLTGLAVAAVAGVAGLTRDQWMNGPPQTVAGAETPKAPEVAAPAAEPVVPTETAAAAPEAVIAAPEAATPVEQPATATAPAPETAAPAETEVALAPEAAAPEPAVSQPEAAPAAVATAPETTPEPIESTPAPATETAAPSPEIPAFDTVRVEKTGEAVIAGTAEAGSEVVIKLDGATIGKTTANDEGAFVVVPDAPLPAGSGALTIEATAKGDKAATASEQTVAVIVPEQPSQDALVAVVSPNEPTKVLQKPEAQPETPPETVVAAVQPEVQTEAQPEVQPEAQSVDEPAPEAAASESTPAKATKQVSLDAVDYDASGNIVFSGRGQPGHGARVYVDNAHNGDAVIDADGRWSFAGTADIAMGVHALRVDGIDAAGKVLNRIEVPFFREETKKVAAAIPDQTVAPAEQKTDQEPAAETAEPVGEAEAATAVEQPAVVAPEKPKDGRVVIQPGNNLWRISKVLYGSGTKYTLLYEANKDQIRDPDRIYPGQVFMTPDAVAPAGTIDPKLREPMKPEDGTANAQ